MKNLLILLAVIFIGCNKQETIPEPVSKYLSITKTDNVYLKAFTVNGVNVTSPALVHIDDKVYIYAIENTIKTGTITVSLDGSVLYSQALTQSEFKKEFIIN